jgi:acetylglutamate kinase
VAAALNARKLIMLTDVEGVLGRDGRLISQLSAAEARALIADSTVSGGMIPKLETCLRALDDGVGAAHVLDGRLPHVLLLETFTEAGVGTKLTLD